MNKDINRKIIEYLKVARVLVSSNDMEEIIGERDSHYGEEDEIDECIKYMENLDL